MVSVVIHYTETVNNLRVRRVIDMANEFPHCDVVGVDLAPPRIQGYVAGPELLKLLELMPYTENCPRTAGMSGSLVDYLVFSD